jgi:fructose-bisphosphate aldolase class II
MAQFHYKELGLVNTREMFQKAMAGHYAVPAYNFNNLEQLEAIIIGCIQSKSPVILQCSGSARKYMHEAMVPHLVKGAVEMMEAMGAKIPIALHLDHGDTFELAKACINSGFSSVMIDGSHHPFEENIRLTRQVVNYAHERDVTVEGELGVLAGVEDEVSAAASHYTRPEEVEEFVQWTGLDSLAISSASLTGLSSSRLSPVKSRHL